MTKRINGEWVMIDRHTGAVYPMTEREIEIEKMLRRERIKEAIAAVVAVPLVMLAFWLYLVATPDQMSGECELARAQMEEVQ